MISLDFAWRLPRKPAWLRASFSCRRPAPAGRRHAADRRRHRLRSGLSELRGLVGLDVFQPVDDAAADLHVSRTGSQPALALERAVGEAPAPRELDLIEVFRLHLRLPPWASGRRCENPAVGCRRDRRGMRRGISACGGRNVRRAAGDGSSPSIPSAIPRRTDGGRTPVPGSIDIESIAAAAIGADQLAPVLLRLEHVGHAQALRAGRCEDGLAALPGLARERGLVQ